MPIDEIDTPPYLATQLLQVADDLCVNGPQTIADFAVGTGALLAAANLRWPRACFFGCDISNERVARLAQTRTDWTVAQCDFLDQGSRSSLLHLENIKTRVDVAVLNPPFSARGATRVNVCLDGQTVRCSPAMAFVLLASHYLSPNGIVVAILPTGALEADRDQGARAALRQLGEFGTIRGTIAKFPGGSLTTAITYLKRGPSTVSPETLTLPEFVPTQSRIYVLRGTLQMHDLPCRGARANIPLVHSTELQRYGVQLAQREVPSGLPSTSGPAVLLHRVGQPRQDKITYVPPGPPFAITDCVVALLCPSEHECLRLHRTLTQNFSVLKQYYIGSGAPYITIRRIQHLLYRLGFASEITKWSHGGSSSQNGPWMRPIGQTTQKSTPSCNRGSYDVRGCSKEVASMSEDSRH